MHENKDGWRMLVDKIKRMQETIEKQIQHLQDDSGQSPSPLVNDEAAVEPLKDFIMCPKACEVASPLITVSPKVPGRDIRGQLRCSEAVRERVKYPKACPRYAYRRGKYPGVYAESERLF